MPHTRQQARTRARRQHLAREAARLMAEGGFDDVLAARRKAAQRLGIVEEAAMPARDEILHALDEHRRLFDPAPHRAQALQARRAAALDAMTFLARFTPRLVGALLDGSADDHAVVTLQLFSDDAEAVPRFLEAHAIPADAGSRRVRLDRSRSGLFPLWRLSAGGTAFDLLVLPSQALRQAPLADGEQAPARRASAAQLRQLIDQG